MKQLSTLTTSVFNYGSRLRTERRDSVLSLLKERPKERPKKKKFFDEIPPQENMDWDIYGNPICTDDRDRDNEANDVKMNN